MQLPLRLDGGVDGRHAGGGGKRREGQRGGERRQAAAGLNQLGPRRRQRRRRDHGREQLRGVGIAGRGGRQQHLHRIAGGQHLLGQLRLR